MTRSNGSLQVFFFTLMYEEREKLGATIVKYLVFNRNFKKPKYKLKTFSIVH